MDTGETKRWLKEDTIILLEAFDTYRHEYFLQTNGDVNPSLIHVWKTIKSHLGTIGSGLRWI